MRSRSVKPVVSDRAELPLTHVIDSSIESAFGQYRRRNRMRAGLDFLQRMHSMLHELAYDRARERALACLEANTHARKVSLERAAQRMHDVDLDSAWKAALSGDTTVLHDRLAPVIQAPPKPTPKGSPWRNSGWLTKRAR